MIITDFTSYAVQGDWTMAFQAAVSAIEQAGGGVLRVPSGVYYTGPIRLTSHMRFEVEAGAEIRFFDDEKNKTRYLCLDTGRYYYYRFRFHTLQTAQFMIDALNTVPSGWNVIAVSHIWTNLVSLETGECRESKYIKPLITILEDYNDRSGGTFSFEGKKIAYDFSEGSGKVVFCIGGHTHADYVVMSEGGIPLITISSDGTTQVAGTPYKRGTITEQCVCIVITDYENNKLHIVHVARGEDTSIDMYRDK